jgi:hypothetical protein
MVIEIISLTSGPSIPSQSEMDDEWHRYIDRDAHVVCWTRNTSIACLPIEQTELEQ